MMTVLEKDITLILWDFADIKVLSEELNSLASDALVVVSKTQPVFSTQNSIRSAFEGFQTDILFSGAALFHFDEPHLKYYYWKYYPRQDTLLDYVDYSLFIGKKESLLLLIEDIIHYDLKQTSLKDAFHRLYVDSASNFFRSTYQIKIDHHQNVFRSTKENAPSLRPLLLSKIHTYLFLKYRDGNKQNALFAYFKSLWKTLIVFIHNKGETRLYKLFRYAPNHGYEVKKSIDTLIGLMEREIPFCFSHFNDGELTFINKYENSDHKEVWFGRRQNQYIEKLGKLLVDAFLLRKENYFVGIPCGKSHPKLRALAIGMREPDDYTIAAMTLHHNIYKYPHILGMLKKKKLYYITNPYQDLTFFKALGLEVKEDHRINVPFKNSHKEYDKLKDYRFEENAIVLMMCGMLGKVLTPIWFEQNPTCTFLTFGSSFDDMIQKNINFKLLPKEAPFARHLVGTRSFLFGAKKSCSDCFDLKNPTSLE